MKENELLQLLLTNGLISNHDPEELELGDWYKDLPYNFQSDWEILMTIITVPLYANWEISSQNILYKVFEDNYSNDEEFISEYLSRTNYENEFFVRSSEKIQMNYELLKQYLSLGHPETDIKNNFYYVHKNVKHNREIMLRLIHDLPDTFVAFDDIFKDDEEIVNIAIRQNGLLLEFASERLRSNEKLVRIAIENNIRAVLFVHKKFREFPDGIFYEEYLRVNNQV